MFVKTCQNSRIVTYGTMGYMFAHVPIFTILSFKYRWCILHDVFKKHKQNVFRNERNMNETGPKKSANIEQIILRCTRSGNLKEFRVNLNERRDQILSWKHPRSGESSLLLCARYGHVFMLQCLVEDYEESLEQWNHDGKRALHEAALGGHLECVKYLISRKVEIDCLKRADWLVRI